ncbi:MAG: PAS domain S-box protein [Methanomicrobiales archaeon]|nr:PAS domain S-box protein [Methanomicrobiales archaeon]
MDSLPEPVPVSSRDESIRIKDFLKKNSRGMNIREISDALKINRNSVAKYLEVLTSREEVEVKNFGKSKVYFLAQRVPVSTLMRLSSNLMLIINRDLAVVQINDAFLQYMGKNQDEVVGSCMQDLNCDLLENEKILAWCNEAISGQEISEEISIDADPSRQYFRVVLTPTRFPDNTTGVILFFENITEKKQIKSALAESEENFRTLVDESGDGCIIVDETGRISAWNRSMEMICGIPGTEAIGSNIVDIICRMLVPEHRTDHHIRRLKKVIHTALEEQSFPLRHMPEELEIQHLAGERRYIRNLTLPIRFGKKLHYGVIVRDITKRKTAEELLRQSEERYRHIVETANEGIWAMDRNLVTTFANQKIANILGYSVDEIVGRPFTDFILPEDQDDNTQKMENRKKGLGEIYERRIVKKDGSIRWVLISATPLKDEDGAYNGSFAMITDITERKAADTLLRESEEKYRRIVETANEGIVIMDKTSVITFVNQKMLDFLGYQGRELVGKTLSCIVHPKERADHEIRMQHRREGRKDTYERRLLRNDKSSCWVLISATPVIDPDGTFAGSFTMVTDITEHKTAEDLLRQNEEKYRRIVETANEGIVVMDQHHRITFVNRRFCDLLGYPENEILGRDITMAMHPDELPDHEIRMQNRRNGKKESYERCLVKKDGSTCWVLISVTPVMDPGGAFEGSFAMLTDITRRHTFEKVRQEAVEQVEKNIEQLAILGEHLRDPLTAILAKTPDMPPETADLVTSQVREINDILAQIDKGWIESEKVRSYLRKYHEFTLPE